MALDCTTSFAKYVLCLFNFLFFVSGLVLLGLGSWIVLDKETFIKLTKVVDQLDSYEKELAKMPNSDNFMSDLDDLRDTSALDHIGYLLLGLGGLVFTVSFLGYCAAVRESRCLLIFYGVFLALLLIVQIILVVLVMTYMDETNEGIRAFLKKSIKQYYNPQDKLNAVTIFWNLLMIQLKCCGVDDYKDFKESPWAVESGKEVPDYCCATKQGSSPYLLTLLDPQCPVKPNGVNSHYETGCLAVFTKVLSENSGIVFIIAIVMSVIQLLNVFFAFCVAKGVHRYMK